MEDSRFYIEPAEVENKHGEKKKCLKIIRRMFVNSYKQPDDKKPDYKAEDKKGFSDIAAWIKSGTYEDKKTGEIKSYDAIDVTMYLTKEELEEALKGVTE